MVLADMLFEENIESSFIRKGRQDDSIGSSDLRILLMDLGMQAIHTGKGTIGYTKRSISTVRSFDSMPPCKHVPGRQRKLDAQDSRGDYKGRSSLSCPQIVAICRGSRMSETVLGALS